MNMIIICSQDRLNATWHEVDEIFNLFLIQCFSFFIQRFHDSFLDCEFESTMIDSSFECCSYFFNEIKIGKLRRSIHEKHFHFGDSLLNIFGNMRKRVVLLNSHSEQFRAWCKDDTRFILHHDVTSEIQEFFENRKFVVVAEIGCDEFIISNIFFARFSEVVKILYVMSTRLVHNERKYDLQTICVHNTFWNWFFFNFDCFIQSTIFCNDMQ